EEVCQVSCHSWTLLQRLYTLRHRARVYSPQHHLKGAAMRAYLLALSVIAVLSAARAHEFDTQIIPLLKLSDAPEKIQELAAAIKDLTTLDEIRVQARKLLGRSILDPKGCQSREHWRLGNGALVLHTCGPVYYTQSAPPL